MQLETLNAVEEMMKIFVNNYVIHKVSQNSYPLAPENMTNG
jgi:hypothetical protein